MNVTKNLTKVAPEQAGLDAGKLEWITEHINKNYIEPGKIAGCQVYVNRHGHTGYFRSFGMKDAERAVFMGGSVTWKKSQDSISLDSKSLLKQHPEYLQQFPQTKAGTRRFQIYPNGG